MEFRRTLEDCLERCRQFKFHRYFVSMIFQRLGVVESEYHFRYESNKGLDYSDALESLFKVREALIELKSKPQFDEFFSENSKHWVSYQALSLVFNQFLLKLEQSGFQNSESFKETSESNKNQSQLSQTSKNQFEVNGTQQKFLNSINKWFKSLQMSSDSGMRLDILEHLDGMKEALKQRWRQLVPRKELQSELTIVFWYAELETLCLSSGRNEVDFNEFERGLDNFSNKLEGLRLPEGSLVKILADKSIANALSATLLKTSSPGHFNTQDINEILPMIYSNPIIKYSYFIRIQQQSQQQQQIYSQLLQQQQLQQLSLQKIQSKEDSQQYLQNLSLNQQIGTGNKLCNSQEIYYLNSNHNITSAATCIPRKDSKNLTNSNGSYENPISFNAIPGSSISMNNQTSQYLQSKTMISKSQLQSEGDFTLPIVEMDDSYKPPCSISLQMIECQTDLIQLHLSENIIITPYTVQLGMNQPQKLRHKNIVCFGRQSKNSISKNNPSQTVKNTSPGIGITSPDTNIIIPSEQDKQQEIPNGNNCNTHRNMCGIQNDVQFKPEVWRVSRQQFRIVWNTMDYYSIVCTSPSNPTLLRLNENSPVELQPNMVFRIADYKFLVNDLSHGMEEDSNELFDPIESSPKQPRLIKQAHNPDSEMQLLLKGIPASIQEINCLENSSQNIPHNNDLVSSIKSYESTFNLKNHQDIIKNNLKPSAKARDYKTSDGKDLGKVRFEVTKGREIITFGRDQRNKFPFDDKEVSRFHCQIVYDSQKCWKLCEKYIPDQKQLSSGGTFVQLQSFDQNKNEQFSDPWPLQEGMLIHSEGAMFKVL